MQRWFAAHDKLEGRESCVEKRGHTKRDAVAGISSTSARLFPFIQAYGDICPLQRAPLKLEYEGSGFHLFAVFKIVRRDTRGVQVGFLTGTIGFTYRSGCGPVQGR